MKIQVEIRVTETTNRYVVEVGDESVLCYTRQGAAREAGKLVEGIVLGRMRDEPETTDR